MVSLSYASQIYNVPLCYILYSRNEYRRSDAEQLDAIEFARRRQRPVPLMSIQWTTPPPFIRPTSISPGFPIRCDLPFGQYRQPPHRNFYHGDPDHFLDDLQSCVVDLMRAVASPSSAEDIATSYNRFPRLSSEVRNAILAATLEVKKYEEENSKKEQARAIAELEDFLRTPPRIPTTTSQEPVPETGHPDLMEMN